MGRNPEIVFPKRRNLTLVLLLYCLLAERGRDGEGGEGQERQAEAQEAEATAGGQTHTRVLLLLLRGGRRAGDVRQEGLPQSLPSAVSKPHQASIWYKQIQYNSL